MVLGVSSWILDVYRLDSSFILDPRWKWAGSYEFGVVILNASQWVSQLVSSDFLENGSNKFDNCFYEDRES